MHIHRGERACAGARTRCAASERDAHGFCDADWLRYVYEDVLVEMSLLIGISYLTFWLGELVMGYSAVIAVVVMGLVLNMRKGSIRWRQAAARAKGG